MKIVVTGASGFIGQSLCRELQKRGYEVTPVVRSKQYHIQGIPDKQHRIVSHCDRFTDWSTVLLGADSVVNLLAKAHDVANNHDQSLLWATNVDALENLALQSCSSGIKHIVHLSSIKVNGEETVDSPFSVTDRPDPADHYGRSKYEAEKKLKGITDSWNIAATIIRPPLVYGPGQKGNLAQLEKMISLGIPLPLHGIKNQRHLISLYNLIDFIICCLKNPKAQNETFLVADNEAISTTRLVGLLGKALGKKAHMFYMPQALIKCCLFLLKKETAAKKLFSSLVVDIGYTCETLDWYPPLTMQESFDWQASKHDKGGKSE